MENELKHYGVLNMKWYVRRYQNRDGTLTALGKKRLSKLDAEREKLTGKKERADGSDESSDRPKSIKEMSNEELARVAKRNQLEADYIRSERTLAELQPATVSKGEQFVNGLSKTLVPAFQQAGKKLVQDYLEKKGAQLLGLNEDELKSLQREVNILSLRKQKKEIVESFTESKTDRLKKENDEYSARKQNEEYKEYFSDAAKEKRQRESDVSDFVSTYKNAAQVMTNAKNIDSGRDYFQEKYGHHPFNDDIDKLLPKQERSKR